MTLYDMHAHSALPYTTVRSFFNIMLREASELKNVTKSGKSPIGGEGSEKKSKSPKFEIWTF